MLPACFKTPPASAPRTSYKPVSDGAQALLGIIPGARVTSSYRGPNHPLTAKNPKSWHSRSRAAVDIAPIPGMTYQDAYNRLSSKYGIIEARDEVSNPSKHATGPHWHFVLGNR